MYKTTKMTKYNKIKLKTNFKIEMKMKAIQIKTDLNYY